ncbi:MAG: hypothetical protein P8168_13505, partial [Deltaproteobacteria bacterium]
MPEKTAATVSGSVNNEKKACHRFKEDSQASLAGGSSGQLPLLVPAIPVPPGPIWALVSQKYMVHLIQAASK